MDGSRKDYGMDCSCKGNVSASLTLTMRVSRYVRWIVELKKSTKVYIFITHGLILLMGEHQATITQITLIKHAI